jgi:RES domain-containing protein
MTTKKLITSDDPRGQQAVAVFRAAYNKAGLDDVRAQALNENRAFAAALRRVIEESSMPIAAPKGGRIHVVRVPVDPAREWQEAVNAAGPNTPASYDIRKVGHLYPPYAGLVAEREIILVNFGKTIPNGQYALDWAKPHGLQPENPRGVFAVGECKPGLNNELGMSYMAVVSLEACSFRGRRQVPCAWWFDSWRWAYLRWFDNDWNDNYWFAFVRE